MTSGRVLIVTWEGGGNVPPALALATRLAARGHAVRVAAPETMRARVEATGARLAPNRSVAALPTDVDLETVWEQVDAVLNGPGAMDDLRLALREEPADIVVVDSMHGRASRSRRRSTFRPSSSPTPCTGAGPSGRRRS